MAHNFVQSRGVYQRQKKKKKPDTNYNGKDRFYSVMIATKWEEDQSKLNLTSICAAVAGHFEGRRGTSGA